MRPGAEGGEDSATIGANLPVSPMSEQGSTVTSSGGPAVGTDIHCFVERRTERGWEPCELDFYCGEERNYALFAILAGVRRMTNGGFEPIVPPRGFPPDSPSVGGWVDGWGYYHNATWLTLRELLEFPWYEKMYPFRWWLDAAQYRVFRQTGRPERFVDGSAALVSNEEMERLLREGGPTEGVLTLVAFGVPYAEFAGPFVTETLPRLQALGPPDDVRLVMFFDS